MWSTPGHEAGRAARWVLPGIAAAAFVSAALVSVQARMNGELGVVFRDAPAAATWSFGSGLLLLSLALLAAPRTRLALRELPGAVRAGRVRWWQCLGGMAGGAFVLVQAYAVPLAGVAVYTIAVVGGQTGNALLVDRIGLGPGGRTAVTPGRVVASVVAVAGVGVAVSGRGAGAASGILLPAVLAFLAGAMSTAQQAVNGRVAAVTGRPFATTWLNFATGSALLAGVGGVRLLTGASVTPSAYDAPWWAWFGALCGIVFIAVASIAVRVLGVLVFTLVVLVGQLSSAIALDLASPATRGHVGPHVVVGVLVTAVAVVLGSWSTWRRTAGSAP